MAEEEFKPWLWEVPEGGVMGKRRIRRQDGYQKASGTAVYSRDVYRPGMLYGKILLSPYSHAKIKSMDTSQAEALPGVRDVLRYDDPEIDWAPAPGAPTAHGMHSQYPGAPLLYIDDTANWYPQQAGAVVIAESEQICDQALKLIEIDWEELPFILDPEEALESGASLLRPDLNPDSNLKSETVQEHGDVEAGFTEADNITEFKVNIEEDVWAGVEAACCVAEWKEDHLHCWSHEQMPNSTKETMGRKFTGMHKFHLHLPYNGAPFDGMTGIGVPGMVSTIAGIAAKRTGKPVKVMYDGSHFHGSGVSHGAYYYKVGYMDDGTITSVKMDTFLANSELTHFVDGTKIPNLSLTKRDPFVTRGPTTTFRHRKAPSSSMNVVINRVADELGMDPTEVALINDGCEGHDMAWLNENVKEPQGFDPTRDSLKEVLEIGKAAIDWDNKWHAPGTKLLSNGNYHGIGFCVQPQWDHAPWGREMSVGIHIRYDGTARILAQRTDIGTNGETGCSMLVADEIGLKYEDVSYPSFEDVCFALISAGGSNGMISNRLPLVRAARKAKQFLLESAVGVRRGNPIGMFGAPGPDRPPLFPDKTAEEMDIKDSIIFEKANPENKLTVAEVVRECSICWNPIEGPFGQPWFFWDYPPIIAETTYSMGRQVHFFEVEVDPDTGKCDVKQAVIVNDAGQVINPDSTNGQQYGGAYMGIGRSNTEAVIYDPQTGVKLNDNLIGYGIALTNDCGPIDCQFIETHLGYGGYGSFGIGENIGASTATLTGPAIHNAIGKWIDFPTTPDKVLKALGKV